jgi:hypothetical protein
MRRPPEGDEVATILKIEIIETPLNLVLKIDNMGVSTESVYDDFESLKVALLNNIIGLAYTLF